MTSSRVHADDRRRRGGPRTASEQRSFKQHRELLPSKSRPGDLPAALGGQQDPRPAGLSRIAGDPGDDLGRAPHEPTLAVALHRRGVIT